MGIGARIKDARLLKGLTQEELAKMIGVTKGAVANYESDTSHPKEPVLYALIEALDVDANYIFQDCVKNKAPSLSDEAQRIAMNFDRLDVHGKEIVSAVISSELRRLDSHKPAAVVKMIPLFGNSFAAGSGEPDFENAWEDFAVPADSPAEFALHVHGDSMEPSLHDGQIVLGVKRKPREGEIGAVLVNGCFYVKEIRRKGPDLLLMSRNRARSDADLYLRAGADDYVKVFGTIIE